MMLFKNRVLLLDLFDYKSILLFLGAISVLIAQKITDAAYYIISNISNLMLTRSAFLYLCV